MDFENRQKCLKANTKVSFDSFFKVNLFEFFTSKIKNLDFKLFSEILHLFSMYKFEST